MNLCVIMKSLVYYVCLIQLSDLDFATVFGRTRLKTFTIYTSY